jgi:hypothetical protein
MGAHVGDEFGQLVERWSDELRYLEFLLARDGGAIPSPYAGCVGERRFPFIRPAVV